MAKDITISAQGLTFKATLNDSATAQAIWDNLPIESKASTWGDEIYFGIPVQSQLESGASAVVQLYDLGYWPPGSAFCIFFGQTPVSRPNEIRAASEVNIIGKIQADAADLRKVRSGAGIRLEKAS